MKIIKILIAVFLLNQYVVSTLNAKNPEEVERQIKKDEMKRKGITKDYNGLDILKKDIKKNQIEEDYVYLILLEYGIEKKGKNTVKQELNKGLEKATEFSKGNKIYHYTDTKKVEEIKASCVKIWEKYYKLVNEGLEQKEALHIALNWFNTKYKK